MKPATGTVLFASPTEWRIGVFSDGSSTIRQIQAALDHSPEKIARAFAETLGAEGNRAGDLVVALAGDSCLSATIATEGLPRHGRGPAMLYRLEEKLPLAAEELAADFVVQNGCALGVCTRAQPLGEMLAALATRRIGVAAVTPKAILALQGIPHVPECADIASADVILWQEQPRVDLFMLDNGQPIAWLNVPAQRDHISLALATQVLRKPAGLCVAAVNLDRELLSDLEDMPDIEVVSRANVAMDDAAMIASARILSGREAPLVDLRRSTPAGAGHLRPLRTAAAAAAIGLILLFVCVGGATFWRAHRYASLEARAESEQLALFQGLFPGQPAPVGIASRLQSILRQSRRGGQLDLPSGGPDALPELRDVLAHLPSTIRLRITEIDLEGRQLRLNGEVPSHADADAIVSSLRNVPALSIEDPQTQQLTSEIVQFSIVGSFTADSPSAPGRDR